MLHSPWDDYSPVNLLTEASLLASYRTREQEEIRNSSRRLTSYLGIHLPSALNWFSSPSSSSFKNQILDCFKWLLILALRASFLIALLLPHPHSYVSRLTQKSNLGQGPRPRPRPTPRTIFAQYRRLHLQILTLPLTIHRLQLLSTDRKPEPARYLTSTTARQNRQPPKLFEGLREPNSALAQAQLSHFRCGRHHLAVPFTHLRIANQASMVMFETEAAFPPK
jgi:hypothetical protein